MNEIFSPQFASMTIAVTNMEKMIAFYSKVFGITFFEKKMHGTKLYEGKWEELDLLLCPAELAQNTAKQNRHQLEFMTSDLSQFLLVAIDAGGSQMGEISDDGEFRSVGIYDPDKNSMVFKQPKS